MRMRHIAICGLSRSTKISSALSLLNGTIFEGKGKLSNKIWILIFSTNFV
jgi:hypothetical protein